MKHYGSGRSLQPYRAENLRPKIDEEIPDQAVAITVCPKSVAEEKRRLGDLWRPATS